MAVSVKSPKPKREFAIVAVRTVPPADLQRSTDFVKADKDKPFDCIEIDGIAVYRVFRKGDVVASYPAPTVIGVRLSNRPFSHKKTVFVRRIERLKGVAKAS